MEKTKRISSVVISLLMIITTLVIMAVPASAATSSKGIATQTIIVTTKGNWWIPGSESITLSQTKGECSYRNFITKKPVKSKVYGEWDIVAKSTDGQHTVKKTLDGSSVKIPLKPNKTYFITVTWDTQANNIRTLGKGSFTSYPTWKVKSTYKVSSCR